MTCIFLCCSFRPYSSPQQSLLTKNIIYNYSIYINNNNFTYPFLSDIFFSLQISSGVDRFSFRMKSQRRENAANWRWDLSRIVWMCCKFLPLWLAIQNYTRFWLVYQKQMFLIGGIILSCFWLDDELFNFLNHSDSVTISFNNIFLGYISLNSNFG